MATVTQPAEQRIRLGNVSWETYERLLKETEESRIRLTYDRGSLEIMIVSLGHEGYSYLLGRFIDILTLELTIPIKAGRCVTMKREDLDRGLESDNCYWIRNEPLMRGKSEFDPNSDPPPDLALEVDISRSSLTRLEIYAALGIPEVWPFDGESLKVYQLTDRQEYQLRKRSLAFPFLPLAEVVRFLHESEVQDETSLVRSFQAWVRKQVLPKFRQSHSRRQTRNKGGKNQGKHGR